MLPFKKAKLAGSYTKDATLAEENRRKKQTVIDRMQLLGQKFRHLNPESAVSHSIEYYRFMAIKAEYDVDDEPSKLAPSDFIDDLWCTHLLDTRSYAMLESLLLPEGGRIHYDLIKDEQADYEGRLIHTKSLYFDKHHSLPPHDIWGNEAHLERAAAQAVGNRGDISDPEDFDDGAIILNGEKVKPFREISIYVVNPLGIEVNVKILETTHINAIFDATLKYWHLSCDTHCFKTVENKRIRDDWAFEAQDGDKLYLRAQRLPR
jgi:hypothetical protein